MFPAALYARVQFCLRKSHAGPRVQQAPGLPCALCSRGGQKKMQTSGDQRRENTKLYPRHMRAPRSNPSLRLPRHGLLRRARSDVERAGFAPSQKSPRSDRLEGPTASKTTGLPTKKSRNPNGPNVVFCNATKSSTWPLLTGNGNSVGLSVLVHLACKPSGARARAPGKKSEETCVN